MALTIGDILGSFANYNAMTDAPLPGSTGYLAGDTRSTGGSGGPASIDWESLIQNDPIYKQAIALYGAQSDAAAAARDQAINTLMVRFGLTPDLSSAAGELGIPQSGLQALLQTLDPHTAALAKENTAAGTSIIARLMHGNDVSNETIRGGLAARGMLQSGDANFRFGEQANRYHQGVYDAFNSLLDAMDKARGQYASTENTLANDQLKAGEDAFNRQMALIQAGLTPGGSSTPPPPPPPPTTVTNPIVKIPGNPYGAAPAPGAGNLYGSLDPGIASQLVKNIATAPPPATTPSTSTSKPVLGKVGII